MRKLTSGFTLTSDVILRLPLTSDDFASRFNWSLKSSRTSLSRTSSSICWSPRKSRSGDFEVDKSTDPRNVLAVPEIWRVPSAISLLSYLHLNDPCGSVQLFLSCRCLISCRCLLKRLARELPVWPTQTNSCRVHMAAYIKLVVWQFPPFSAFSFIFFFLFVIVLVDMISLHILHFGFLQGSVLGTCWDDPSSDNLLFTRIFFSVLVRRYATIGVDVKILFAFLSFCSRWKCFFRDVDRRERLGCQSQTKIVWGSCFTLIVSRSSSSRVIRDTSLMDLSRNILLYPLFSKKDARVAQCLKKSEFWLHIRRTRMNWPLGMFLFTCFGWFEDVLRYKNASVGFVYKLVVMFPSTKLIFTSRKFTSFVDLFTS